MKVIAIASLLLGVCLPGSVAGQTPVSADSGSSRGVDVSKSRPARETSAVSPKHIANPLAFEANVGQTDKRVKFLTRGQGYSLFLTDHDAVFAFGDRPANPKRPIASHEPSPSRADESSFRMSFVGANPSPQVSGTDKLEAESNYLIGNEPEQWHTHIRNYGKVLYTDLYPGISALYYGNDRKLEYDLKVQPGAAVDRIALVLDGATDLHLDKSGDLAFHCGTREVGIQKPTVYQISDAGARVGVPGSWVLKNGHTLGFSIPKYDHSRELVIDPSFNFGQSSFPLFTYLPSNSSSGYTQGSAIAMGPGGSVYVGGETDLATFPGTSGKLQTSNPNGSSQYAGFVSMFNTAGVLQWSTFLGGATDVQSSSLPSSFVAALAVNSAGNAFVTGQTYAHGSFPTSPSQTGCGSPVTSTNCSDVFVTELSSNGASLVYSNFIDGSAGWAIALDSSGNAYVAGQTDSAGTLTGVVQTTFGGGECDAFVAKVNAGGGQSWWTYFGGGGDDVIYGIALDSARNVYVTGDTTSAGSTPIPTMNPYQATSGSAGANYSAFVTELNNSGTALIFSTYLGGSGIDYGQAMAVDSQGGILVAGQTTSPNFPILNALQPTFPTSPQGGIAFIAKFAPGGSSLDYSTYLGGAQGSDAWAITTDSSNNAYVGGVMQTPATTPVPANPNGFLTISPIDSNMLNLGSNAIQSQCGDYPAVTCYNGFVTEISPTGNQFLYFTYIGGNGATGVLGLALDASAGCSLASSPLTAPCVYATGYTSTTDSGYSSDQSYLGASSYDAFVAQIPSIIEPVCSPTVTEVGLKITVTLTCTQSFTGGQGAINWGDGAALTTISLQGTGTNSTPVSHIYSSAPSATTSVSMTDSAGNATSFATPFPVTQVAPVAVSINGLTNSVVDGSTLALSASVQNADGVNGSSQSNAWVTWNTGGQGTVAPCANRPAALTTLAAGDQVTDCGVYTPPVVQTATNTTIVATDVGDGTTHSNVLTVTVYPELALSPSTTQTVQVTGTAFTIPVSTSPSQSVNWTLTGTGCSGSPCGSINTTTQSSSSYAAGPSTSVVYTVPANLPSNAQVTDVLTATTPSGVPVQTATVSFTINPGTVSVQINPSNTQTVVATQASTIPFAATVSGTTNMAVTWSLSGSGCNTGPCGSLNTTTGVYTPPSAAISNPAANTAAGVTDTVKATSQIDTTKSASDNITIYNPATVSFTPSAPSVASGTAGFPVTEQLVPYDPNQNVTWQLTGTSCNGAPCGKISTAGPSTSTVYTPPAALPTSVQTITETLVATPVAGPASTGSLPIVVNLPAVTFSSFGPTSPPAEIASQTTPIQFSATITGATNATVLWSVTGTGCGTGSPCGSINAAGLYTILPTTKVTAVSGIATDTVTGTSQANPTQSDSAQVSIYNPATVTLNPSGNSVQAVASQAFTVTATLSPTVPGQSQNVTWQLSGTGCNGAPCGSLNTAGPGTSTVYKPPAGLPSTASIIDTLTATSVAEPTQSGQSAITVTPLPVSVSISPILQTVVSSQSSPIQFTATVTGPSNTAVTWTLSGTGCSNAPCGTLSASGLYTPPGSAIANPGAIDTVTATSQADPTKSASTTVTVNNPVTISISPAGVSGQFAIQIGQSQTFTSIVTGSSNTSVTWSVTGTGCSGGPCGTITQPTSSVPATYTAPTTLASSETDTIVATSVADPTKTAKVNAVIFLPPAVSAPPSSITVAPGGTATYTVTLKPGTGNLLYGETLSCLNLPNGVTCVFTPNPLPAGATSFTVQVTTTAPGVSSMGNGRTTMLAGLVPLIGLFLFGLRGSGYRKRLMRNFSLVVLSMLVATGIIACGTGGTFGTAQMSSLLATPPGVYTITVQATSNVPPGQPPAPNAFIVTTLPLTVN